MIDEIKKAIEQRAGIPADLITSETKEGAIAQARELLRYKQQNAAAPREKSGREQFRDWFQEQTGTSAAGEDPHVKAMKALDEIERGPGYPMVPDGGELNQDNRPDTRTPAERFGEWFREASAWDPTERGPRGEKI